MTTRWWMACAALLLGGLAAACGSDDGGGGSKAWSPEAIASSQRDLRLQLVGSPPGRGPARIAFGLFDRDGALVHDARGSARLFTLAGEQATPAGDFALTPIALHETPDHAQRHGKDKAVVPVATVYVVNAQLDRAEWWGAELSVQVGGKEYGPLRMRFFVVEQTREPAIGAAAPRSTQRVLRDVRDIAEIDSSNPPRPELHGMTVAEAVASGRPSLVAFATPAFCQTRFCGPVVDVVVAPLAKQYAGRANFLHIEPYKLDQARQGKLVPIPELEQWGLTSEPYLFLLDGQGKVAAKFEGITSAEEVSQALEKVLKGVTSSSGAGAGGSGCTGCGSGASGY